MELVAEARAAIVDIEDRAVGLEDKTNDLVEQGAGGGLGEVGEVLGEAK